MANFIPHANGVSRGNYFLAKMAVFEAKTGLQKLQRHPNLQTFFELVSIFEPVRDKAKNFRKTVLGARARQNRYCRFSYRQTNSLTPYTGGCGFFLQVKFATSLLASLAGDNTKLFQVEVTPNFLQVFHMD